jgi:hypothetical protein
MQAIVPLILVIAVPALVYSFLMFDRLVRAEYEYDRAAWEADGKPRGFFWRAPECTWFRSPWSIHRLSLLWLFTTPPWTAKAPDALKSLRRLRVAVVVWCILIVLAALLVPFTFPDHAA